MKIQIKVLNKEFYSKNHKVDMTKDSVSMYNLPDYSTPGSAAIDLVCTQDVTVYPGETKLIPTGLAVWIGSDSKYPDGHYSIVNRKTWYHEVFSVAGLILPRSGLGNKGLILGNTVGLIDEDYQGELMVSAWNRNDDEKINTINSNGEPDWEYKHQIDLFKGDRFAQLLFFPVIKPKFEVVEEFSNKTERSQGGFGSTGE